MHDGDCHRLESGWLRKEWIASILPSSRFMKYYRFTLKEDVVHIPNVRKTMCSKVITAYDETTGENVTTWRFWFPDSVNGGNLKYTKRGNSTFLYETYQSSNFYDVEEITEEEMFLEIV